MKSFDFEYDGIRLSDQGLMLCSFDSGGIETIENGAAITFNQVATLNGDKHETTSAVFEDCLTATLQICKSLCDGGSMEISLEELRDIMRWLNRKGFHKFKLLDDEYSGIYFEASFNVSKIEIDGRLYGLELEVITNRPFALQEPITMVIDNDKPNIVRTFLSKSDQEGFIYPDNMEITIKQDGDLIINGITENRVMSIRNCKQGEVIKIDYPIITSSLPSHKIQNDFNWIFFRVTTSFRNKSNEFTVSLPCTIKLTYTPIAKVGIQ